MDILLALDRFSNSFCVSAIFLLLFPLLLYIWHPSMHWALITVLSLPQIPSPHFLYIFISHLTLTSLLAGLKVVQVQRADTHVMWQQFERSLIHARLGASYGVVSPKPTADHAGWTLHDSHWSTDGPIQGSLSSGDGPPESVVDPTHTGRDGYLSRLGVHAALYGNAWRKAGVLKQSKRSFKQNIQL